MEEFTLLSPLLLTIGGLIIGAILKSLLKHSRLPYTVGLFLVGLAVGICNRSGLFHFQKTFLHLLTLWQISIQT